MNIDEELTIADMIEDDSIVNFDTYTSIINAQKNFMKTASTRERMIYKLSIIDGLTQGEIAEIMNVTQAHISRTLTKIKSKLKESV